MGLSESVAGVMKKGDGLDLGWLSFEPSVSTSLP